VAGVVDAGAGNRTGRRLRRKREGMHARVDDAEAPGQKKEGDGATAMAF